MEQLERPREELARYEDAPMQRSIFDELLPPEKPYVCYIAAAVALILALVSIFVVAPWAGSPETYAGTIASLDEKRDTVMQLVTGSTATSAGITLLPGDVGTPIAEKILDLGADFAIVIGAIYLEKYALTILGLAAFRFLVPIGCIMFAVAALMGNRPSIRSMLAGLSARLTVFGIAISLVVPISVSVSNIIEATYETSMNQTIEALEQTADEAEAAAADAEAGTSNNGNPFVNLITSIPENVSNAATGVSQEVQARLNMFIETLAVMIVTSCVIPILVLLFFLWLAKTILGVRIEVPVSAVTPRSMRRLKK
jgi:hypothetical protein